MEPLEAQAELISFRRFQAMPQHRRAPVHHQLRRFLGTRATRKIRSAQRLVEALDLARLPHPLVQLAARLLETASQVRAAVTPNPVVEPDALRRGFFEATLPRAPVNFALGRNNFCSYGMENYDGLPTIHNRVGNF